MERVQYSFKRYEKKFLLTPEQYRAILPVLKEKLAEDGYGVHTVCNLYFDTDNFDLIRRSVEKPPYKEKFRLRSYGVPEQDSIVFAEIKKKFNGVVYKRRVDAPPQAIYAFVQDGQRLHQDPQIQREIQWFLQMYQPEPKVFIGYERLAMNGLEDPALRVTFDWNIRWRSDRLDLCEGDAGEPVLSGKQIVMEVKTPSAIPLWLVSLLSEYQIYSTGFSKYGTCYQQYIAPIIFGKRKVHYA
ncbi:MAG: polyphosphate polymerase domain-containing protein [Clostridiaceae bacterium]|nr:polyphosphate polymerase domain-containing protein [Clostridiaceae bacterium]